MLVLFTAVWVLTLFSICSIYAADTVTTAVPENQADNTIRITADQLVTDTQSQNAEFIGNVKVTRGDTVILSDRLKIFYSSTSNKGNQIETGAESIRKIVAEGKVKITFDVQVATTQRAEWSPKDQTIVLSGPGSKIVSGKNSITGSKITVHQVGNRIKVEGGNNERVEAVFYSEENGLPIPDKKQ